MKGEETVTLLRDSPGGVDKYGDPITSTTTRIDIPGCEVAPTLSGAGIDQSGSDRESSGVIIGWTIYAPAYSGALYTDRIEVRGVACRIEGEIGDWTYAGNVINAVRTVGAP